MKQNYYIFLIGRLISSFGNWFVEIALPFVLYDITGSPLAVATSFLLETLPILLMAPYTAYIVDHCSKKKILIICQVLSTIVIAVCMLTACNNIFVLYSACLLFSVLGNIYTTTVNAYIPELSGNLDLELANILDSYAGNISMIAAPILAGWCVEYMGKVFSFGIDGITFVISAIFFIFLPSGMIVDREDTSKLVKRRTSSYLAEMRNALSKSSDLMTLIVICVLFSACGSIFSALDAVYVAEIFDNSVDIYGYINSAWGAGMLVTGSMYFVYKNSKDTDMFLLGILFMGIATIGYGLSNTVVSCVLFNFLGGLANTLYVVYYRTLIQKNTDETNRGGTFTIQSTISKIISMIVVGGAGIVAEYFSVRYVIVIAGCLALSVALLGNILLNRQMKSRTRGEH